MLWADMAFKTKPQKAVVRLMCAEAGQIQVKRYQTYNNGAPYGDGVALRAGRHTHYQRTENENYIPRIFNYVSKTYNR
ncbi:unnamed protein product [marine sediment metagenome]|uniref:Uncharacterized protein n=1 Tax=marine sediment metagenome TaxID=412755 RepID=X1G3K5_9ZZZZ